jgi:hypothetical protein
MTLLSVAKDSIFVSNFTSPSRNEAFVIRFVRPPAISSLIVANCGAAIAVQAALESFQQGYSGRPFSFCLNLDENSILVQKCQVFLHLFLRKIIFV